MYFASNFADGRRVSPLARDRYFWRKFQIDIRKRNVLEPDDVVFRFSPDLGIQHKVYRVI